MKCLCPKLFQTYDISLSFPLNLEQRYKIYLLNKRFFIIIYLYCGHPISYAPGENTN